MKIEVNESPQIEISEKDTIVFTNDLGDIFRVYFSDNGKLSVLKYSDTFGEITVYPRMSNLISIL